MRSVSPGGRILWPLLLLATVLFVATDFVRHPFEGVPAGVAAAPRHEVTLWVPGTDAGSAPASVARVAAQQLSRRDEPVRAGFLRGGSAAAIDALLDDQHGFSGGLLVVNAGTIADLERDRTELGLPGVADDATHAAALLARAQPIALLADDELVLVTDRGSRVHSAAGMLASLRRTPGRLVFGVGSDAWSKTALGALIDAAHPPGHVPFRVLPTASAAAISTSGDTADVVVAPRGELRSPSVTDRLRVLARGDGSGAPVLSDDPPPSPGGDAIPRLSQLLGSDAPIVHAHRWIALVAPPQTSEQERRALATRVRRLTRSAGWRATLRQLALEPPPDVPAGPYLVRASREERALAAAARRVPEAPGALPAAASSNRAGGARAPRVPTPAAP